MTTTLTALTAEEYRTLGHLMRAAREDGYTFERTDAFGARDHRWYKNCAPTITAERWYSSSWHVSVTGRGSVKPASMVGLVAGLAGLGVLPMPTCLTLLTALHNGAVTR